MMEPIKSIMVQLQFDANEIEVGELVINNNKIFFKYNNNFIKNGLEISPLKLKLNTELNSANLIPFEGLFGVFADSLPDGWGALLLDRALTAKGININNLTPLDRLAYISTSGMGALIYKPKFELESQFNFKIELDKIAKESKK